MKRFTGLLLVLAYVRTAVGFEHGEMTALSENAFYSLSPKDVDGNDYAFSDLEGKTVYILNIAVDHEHAARYMKDIANLGDKYARFDLQILLFPCDQFGDTGTPEQYKSLLHRKQQGVRMMAKVDVRGANASPVFKLLNGGGTVERDFGALHVVDSAGQFAYKFDVEGKGFEPRAREIEMHFRDLIYQRKRKREL